MKVTMKRKEEWKSAGREGVLSISVRPKNSPNLSHVCLSWTLPYVYRLHKLSFCVWTVFRQTDNVSLSCFPRRLHKGRDNENHWSGTSCVPFTAQNLQHGHTVTVSVCLLFVFLFTYALSCILYSFNCTILFLLYTSPFDTLYLLVIAFAF